MMSTPKVSVCVPVYNGGAYIAECIESILAQTYKDFRLIVCDNCSTDDTETIVRSFDDPRLTYMRNQENLGPVGNANRCLSLAEGEYVCIFHHDDVMLPENLERKVCILDENPGVGLVHSDIFVTDHAGQIRGHWNEESRRNYVEDGMVFFHRYISRMHLGAMIFIGAVLARRACYERLGGYSVELPHTNDNEMWMRMALFYNVACIGIPLVKWRWHSTSGSTGWEYLGLAWLEEHFLATRIIFQKYREKIPDWINLRKEVDERFLKQVLWQGLKACGNDDLQLAKNYLRLGRGFSKDIMGRKDYWGLKLRIALGPKGLGLFRFLKRKLKGIGW